MKSLASIAILFAVIGFALVQVAQAADMQTQEGTVVSATAGKLVITDNAAKEHTFTVDTAAKINVHGKPAKLDELKKGDHVRLTVTNDKVTEIQGLEAKPAK